MFQTAFWREELWHPLTVHFPVALLLFATIIRLTALFLKEQHRLTSENLASLLLLAGSLTAWLAIYTGNLADGVVARTLCDPTVLKSHEIASYTMAYLFTSAAILNLLLFYLKLRDRLAMILRSVVVLLMISGSGYLAYGAHLGASLVYDQGAGLVNRMRIVAVFKNCYLVNRKYLLLIMITLKRCDSTNEGFQALIKELDKVLRSRYNEVQNQYDQFNNVDAIKNVVVAYLDNKPVGCGCFKKFDEDSVEIKRMFVSEDKRGKGIALAILKELELWAKELNYKNAVLETGVKLPEAMGLYQRHQYVITDNYGQYIGMENSVCMKKSLHQ